MRKRGGGGGARKNKISDGSVTVIFFFLNFIIYEIDVKRGESVALTLTRSRKPNLSSKHD